MDSNLFAGDIAADLAKELAKELVKVLRRAYACRSIAEQLKHTVDGLLPIVHEIRYSGVELPQPRQSQLSELAMQMNQAIELTRKAADLPRWNVYRSVQLARKMEKIERWITKWTQRQMPAHVLADVHTLRVESDQRISRIEHQIGQLVQIGHMAPQIGHLAPPIGQMALPIGQLAPPIGQKGEEIGQLAPPIGQKGEGIGQMASPIGQKGEGIGQMAPQIGQKWDEIGMEILNFEELRVGFGARVGRERVKEMVMREREGNSGIVVGISGIGGSGKTTLAREICRDLEIRAHFNDRIHFETISQSPNLQTLKLKLHQIPPNPGPILIVLDDVWNSTQLEELGIGKPGIGKPGIGKPGIGIPDWVVLVVSRFRFPDFVEEGYEMELLGEQEALELFCRVVFEQENVPVNFDKKLVKQVAAECKGLPLALKVIGSALHGQKSAKIWAGAKNRLSKSESVSESHENQLLERMATSIECLNKKVRECFLDLGCFAEDRKIRLDLLMNIWMETHDLDEFDAFAILIELANKNLLTLVKDAENKAGDLYSCYSEISVTQHDVLRDLAVYAGNRDPVNRRKRLLMPRKEDSLPREWERNKNIPFDAQIVSIHTGKIYLRNLNKSPCIMSKLRKRRSILEEIAKKLKKSRPAIYAGNRDPVNRRKRLLIPRKEDSLPREWERNKNIPFDSQIVSIHIGEMKESDWFEMQFPKAEVLILNFSSNKYFLPPFINTMPNLKTLILINSNSQCATLENLTAFTTLNSLKSLWLEKLRLPPLPKTTIPLKTLTKVSLTQCESKSSLKGSKMDLSITFPRLSDLTLDHCVDLKEVPSSICDVVSLSSLTISNCHDLFDLPNELGKLTSLQILRVYSCPNLRKLPQSIGGLRMLKYLDISQCVNIKNLPDELGNLVSLEKIDMRECSQLRNLPRSFLKLKSLGHVVCDEETALVWKEAGKEIPDLRIQIAEESYDLDWIVE